MTHPIKSVRPFNFSAGPAMLPESILREAQDELLNWNNLGISVMEVGHRTHHFKTLMEETENDFRELLNIPDNYHVLFLGGATRTQFAMVPMNLLTGNKRGAYLVSGLWSSMAYQEAERLADVYCAGSSENSGFTTTPDTKDMELTPNTSYLYYTPNETVNGVQFSALPENQHVPLVADMTSCLLMEPCDISAHGLIFAGAQKTISTAGLTIVIIRNDLLTNIGSQTLPTMLDYNTHIKHQSIYATPPAFNCYLAGKMFKWIKSQGGVEQLYERNLEKAEKLYQFIDESNFYHCKVSPADRSFVNICFHLNHPELEEAFIRQAEKEGLLALKGHRLAGGIRASLYNAMPLDGVTALIKFMRNFARTYTSS